MECFMPEGGYLVRIHKGRNVSFGLGNEKKYSLLGKKKHSPPPPVYRMVRPEWSPPPTDRPKSWRLESDNVLQALWWKHYVLDVDATQFRLMSLRHLTETRGHIGRNKQFNKLITWSCWPVNCLGFYTMSPSSRGFWSPGEEFSLYWQGCCPPCGEFCSWWRVFKVRPSCRICRPTFYAAYIACWSRSNLFARTTPWSLALFRANLCGPFLVFSHYHTTRRCHPEIAGNEGDFNH